MSWSYKPPLGDLLPGARPFYAKIGSFSLACPRCGQVFKCSSTGHLGWNPLLSRWTCPECRRVWHLGIVAWPVGKDGSREQLPTDTLPTLEQSHLLGQQMVKGKRGREGVNVVVEDPEEEAD